jgi:choline dehydrogenase-like flavoprotein
VTEHAVVIAGAGPTGLMLAGELALAGVDVAIVERRPSQDLPGSRAGGLQSRTIEVLDQRGIADRFLAEGQVAQVAGFASIRLDISDFPTRHPYGLGLWQKHIERILAGWVAELKHPVQYGTEVTGFAQDETGVDVALSSGQRVKAVQGGARRGRHPGDIVRRHRCPRGVRAAARPRRAVHSGADPDGPHDNRGVRRHLRQPHPDRPGRLDRLGEGLGELRVVELGVEAAAGQQ